MIVEMFWILLALAFLAVIILRANEGGKLWAKLYRRPLGSGKKSMTPYPLGPIETVLTTIDSFHILRQMLMETSFQLVAHRGTLSLCYALPCCCRS